jgi:phosphopantothenoylcysteine decarboxylase/phosphopantothenate--cysteine ligase
MTAGDGSAQMSATGDQTPGDQVPGAVVVPKSRPNVVLGVGGGIAAYKVCDLLRRLTESGHSVRVVPTAAALDFVGVATWAALSGQPVTADPFDDVH